MTTLSQFQPKSGIEALFDTIYQIKFSRNVPLFAILLSGIWAVHRSSHYMQTAFHLDWLIAFPSALFIEILVVSAAAMTFIMLREVFVTELRNQDTGIAKVGAWSSLTILSVSLAALIGIAWADAMNATQEIFPALLMAMIQLVQSGMIALFIISALLDERHALREQYKDLARELTQRQAQECPYCKLPISSNNRARHLRSCALNPANQT